MEKEMVKLNEILTKKIPVIVEAIEKADPVTEDYNKLLTNFNSSMVIYSEIQQMFAAKALAAAKAEKEAEKDGTNN